MSTKLYKHIKPLESGFLRWILTQNSVVSMIHLLSFFSPSFFIRGREKEKGWVIDTSKFCLRTHAHLCLNDNLSVHYIIRQKLYILPSTDFCTTPLNAISPGVDCSQSLALAGGPSVAIMFIALTSIVI